MRLYIEPRYRYVSATAAEPWHQWEKGKPKEEWAPKTDQNGELLWRIDLLVLAEGEAQVIRVGVPGDPKVAQGEPVQVEGLSALPYEVEGKSGVSFRAVSIRPVGQRAAGAEKAAA